MRRLACLVTLCASIAAGCGGTASADTLTGAAAYGDWHDDAPGLRRLITPSDLPKPFATPYASNGSAMVPRPAEAMPMVPDGFAVSIFASGLEAPRIIRVAPNGDIFVAESYVGRIRVLRAGDGATQAEASSVFADHLAEPYGIAFYPPGPSPRYVYVADTDAVIRFPYVPGDVAARGPGETVVSGLPIGGHWTRDLVFSPDGQTMYVSVGSASNDAEEMPHRDRAEIVPFEMRYGLGAAWGPEEGRADVLVFDPGGGRRRVFATGLRNCSGEAIEPASSELWCATNERDSFGDNLPPDFVTRVRPGAFYGWPWYYIGANEDPNYKGQRPDLATKVTTPDVLLQAHSAPLGITFYTGTQFPAEYRGDAFVALHGSWNRAKRTGYKVIRVLLKDGAPTGEYEDFMTGLVANDKEVWGRPVGVAVARDGALLVTDDAGGVIWRIAHAQ